MKKICKIGLLCTLLILGGCANKDNETILKENASSDETITLHIKVKDEVNNKELFNGDVSVEGNIETLEDFLKQADILDTVIKDDGQYTTLMSLLGVSTENFNEGPWWLYESENNKSCQATGMCDAINVLEIENGDSFIFRYTSSY